MANPNIAEEARKAGVQFKKGQSGNPNGRPKKSFRLINDELKADGYEPLSKSQLIDAYSLIFNADEEKLKKLTANKNTPFALRLIIQELADKKTRSRALADYRDYMFGKALQSVEVSGKITISEDELED